MTAKVADLECGLDSPADGTMHTPLQRLNQVISSPLLCSIRAIIRYVQLDSRRNTRTSLTSNTSDFKEGVKAFAEKRKPVFVGK